MEIDLLCEDIQGEIFGRLPLEALNNCKLVSKQWNHMVYDLFSTRGSSGFIVPYHGKLDLITVKFGLAYVELNTILEKNFSSYKGWPLLVSCNGLLLFMGMESSGRRNVYCVCNPVLSQYVNLPKPRGYWYSDMTKNVGLAYDGIPGHRYILVYMRHDLSEVDVGSGIVEYEIFSSETWKWRQARARLFNMSLLGDVTRGGESGSLCPSSVYWKGALYWTIMRKKYMLIYHVGKEFFKLVKLPSYNIDSSSSRVDYGWSSGWLSESNGQLYYCYASCDKIYVWEYTSKSNSGEHDYDDGDMINKYWLLKHATNYRLDCQGSDQDSKILHCRFYSDLELVYIQVGYETIYSYSFMTREVKEVWRTKNSGLRTYEIFFPYAFSLVDLPMKTSNIKGMNRAKLSKRRVCFTANN